MARNDDRRRMREDTERGLRELADADWDETSEVVASAAAKAAAKTAHRMSRPDTDSPDSIAAKPPWHRTPAAKAGGAIAAVLTALASLLAALQQAGLLR
jgi:hypothetical protein